MADLVQQIRERLDELMRPPADFAEMFLEHQELSPEQEARLKAEFDEILGKPQRHKLVVIPPSPIERMRNAILAAVDEHKPHHDDPTKCSCGDPDDAYACNEYPDRTLRGIAAALGIAIRDSRIEDGDG